MAWTESDLNAALNRLKVPPAAHQKPAECFQAPESTRKYGNRTTATGGHVFASAREADVYRRLSAMAAAGLIRDLTLQPRFELQPAFVTRWGKKLRAVVYVGDFQYREPEPSQQVVVIDSKGYATPGYKIKAKLFMFKYPEIRFEEW